MVFLPNRFIINCLFWVLYRGFLSAEFKFLSTIHADSRGDY